MIFFLAILTILDQYVTIRSHMLSEATKLSLWDVLSDPKRRQLLQLLMKKPRTTSELCAYFEVSRFAVMKHLKVLEASGLIDVQRDGRQRWNVLNNKRLQKILREDSLGESGLMANWQETAVSPHSRHVALTFSLDVPAETLFRLLTTGIDAWWPHRKLENSRVILEPFVNGRFFEAAGTQAGILLGTVTAIIPNQEIRLQGSLGVAEEAIVSNLTLALESCNDHTQFHLQHHLFGAVNDTISDDYTSWWEDVINLGLKEYLVNNLHYNTEPG